MTVFFFFFFWPRPCTVGNNHSSVLQSSLYLMFVALSDSVSESTQPMFFSVSIRDFKCY